MPHAVHIFQTANFRSRTAGSRWILGPLILFCAFVLLAKCAAASLPEAANPGVLTLAQLRDRADRAGVAERSIQFAGVVRAVVPDRGIVALQDGSTAAVLELPFVDSTVSVGQQLTVETGPCVLSRTRYGVRVSALPVIDNDGLHSQREVSGSVFLKSAGWEPVRVEWFNGPAEFALKLEYEGPDCPRQKVPDSVLRCLPSGDGSTNLQPGLCYRAYEQSDWRFLPDFSWLIPVREGVATNFTPGYRSRDENCGLTFDGFVEIRHPGWYTFHLASDDGARLYLGRPLIACETAPTQGPAIPVPESLEQALSDRGRDSWIELEGEVTYVSQAQRELEMEVVVGGNHVPVTVLEGEGLFSTNLLHGWVRVAGVCKFSQDAPDKRLTGVFVPGPGQVKILGTEDRGEAPGATNELTTAAQVRTLKPAEAARNIPAKVRGVVIYATAGSMVLRDASGGVFIGSRGGRWPRQPGVGEFWECEGTTDPGYFAPVIVADTANFLGYAPLPEPIQPTRDQLMNGNLDAEYAELHGVITSVSTNAITLLTPDGKVTVLGAPDRPLPPLPGSIPDHGSLIGSVVRIRGCFATLVDLQTKQVTPGQIYIYPALVEVEDPSPPDPFALPARQPKDLMWFNARASALLRTKLAGQILYASPGKYFVWDGRTGFRVLANNAAALEPGDFIEAVGFPKLGGPSPVLQEAQIRRTGHAALPPPVEVLPERLLDRGLDSTPVEVRATLISDTLHPGERVLELQNGPRHFVARLRTGPQLPALLAAGCQLKLTGVYASADEDQEQIGATSAPFELLLNSAAGIAVLQSPSWWTLRRAVILVVALAGLLCMAFIWVAQLRRQVEERTAQLKQEIEGRQLVEQRHAIERERTRVAQDLHDELGAGLTEVSMLGSLADTPAISPEAKHRYLDQITQMARSLVTSLDEIVWAVNPNYDSLGSLVSYFSLFAQSFLGLAGITCRLRVAPEIPECPLDARQRHGIFCAFKEALNNVIRHSRATEVRIAFEVIAGELVLTVVDNGCGFEFIAGAPGRDGLAGLSWRMQQLGGRCQITSGPGQGAKIEIHLPLSGIHHG
jgi:signal transduction histidine kinase